MNLREESDEGIIDHRHAAEGVHGVSDLDENRMATQESIQHILEHLWCDVQPALYTLISELSISMKDKDHLLSLLDASKDAGDWQRKLSDLLKDTPKGETLHTLVTMLHARETWHLQIQRIGVQRAMRRTKWKVFATAVAWVIIPFVGTLVTAPFFGYYGKQMYNLHKQDKDIGKQMWSQQGDASSG